MGGGGARVTPSGSLSPDLSSCLFLSLFFSLSLSSCGVYARCVCSCVSSRIVSATLDIVNPKLFTCFGWEMLSVFSRTVFFCDSPEIVPRQTKSIRKPIFLGNLCFVGFATSVFCLCFVLSSDLFCDFS